MLIGLVALRWGALAWMSVALAVSYDDLKRPWLALGLTGLALVYTALVTTWLQSSPSTTGRPAVLLAELTIAVGLVLCDGWAYSGGHAFATSQSLGSIWPLAAVLNVAAALGPLRGAAAGALLGAARVGATLANGVRSFEGGQILSLTNTTALYVLAGAVAGQVVALLRQAEREISAARAREEVARTLHDGVLQTLAVVQRRSTDADLVQLAREQDRDLRRYLFGDGRTAGIPSDLGAALRQIAARFERAFHVPVDVLVPPDLPALDDAQAGALTRAVGEALTNVGKHAHATRITVFVEPDDDGAGVFCSVKDDGAGFDSSRVPSGIGITESIVARLRDAGGRAEVRSRPGHGTEVCLWV